jgi:hypothetical protein
MTQTQRFAIELAKTLKKKYGWGVTDGSTQYDEPCVENTKDIQDAVQSNLPILLSDGVDERIAKLEAELKCWRGMK